MYNKLNEGDKLNFRVSAGLKNIIGSDLIGDDFIAIFELVKNSYDAHATEVRITFERMLTDSASITIEDDGKGMNAQDLKDRWLFVAYSAKVEGTEDDNYDYRSKINTKRDYAGAKGIGRFSCDRLGRYLYLETLKNEHGSYLERLLIDWEKFETDLKDDFVNIEVLHVSEKNVNDRVFSHGTKLVISNLKSSWDRKKVKKLIDALAKLISPDERYSNDKFDIEIIFPEELDNDTEDDRVNGKVQNKILNTLDLKTTKITSEISEEGNTVKTILSEGGKNIYSIVERSPLQYLRSTKYVLYFLNRSAKHTFTRRMGLNPVEYGHVFMYKNGIRIYPYGERGEDPLKVDNRKTQAYGRNIGNRELFGFISIGAENQDLKETSSRGDGLKKTDSYLELVSWFYTTLRRLERYVVDITKWGNELTDNDFINLNDSRQQKELGKLITSLTKSKELLSFKIAPEIYELIERKQSGSAKTKLKELTDQIKNKKFDKISALKQINKVEQQIDTLKKTASNAEESALNELMKNEALAVKLESQIKKGAFQGALIATDKERILGLQHQIYHSSGRINRNIDLLVKHLKPNKLDGKTQKYIKIISLESKKINAIANFVTKANFNLKASTINVDIVQFMIDYLNEIYIHKDSIIDTNVEIDINNNTESVRFEKAIRPLELTSVIDNFVSNSEKANASHLNFNFYEIDGVLQITIEDDGCGISQKDLPNIYELGFSTTNGSGIGLHLAHDIITKSMKGEIEVSSSPKGTVFKLLIP